MLQGSLEAETFWVFHWAFRARKLVPSSRHEEGDVREMTLVPFAEQKDLQSVNQANDGFEVPEWWEEEDAGPPAGAGANQADPADGTVDVEAGNPVRRAGVVATIYAVVLSVLLVIVAHRYGRALRMR